jgi:hypothetical protein
MCNFKKIKISMSEFHCREYLYLVYVYLYAHKFDKPSTTIGGFSKIF